MDRILGQTESQFRVESSLKAVKWTTTGQITLTSKLVKFKLKSQRCMIVNQWFTFYNHTFNRRFRRPKSFYPLHNDRSVADYWWLANAQLLPRVTLSSPTPRNPFQYQRNYRRERPRALFPSVSSFSSQKCTQCTLGFISHVFAITKLLQTLLSARGRVCTRRFSISIPFNRIPARNSISIAFVRFKKCILRE